MMTQLGVPLPVTRDAVGHMSDTVTRHYTHIHEKVARAAVEKLEQFRNTPRFGDVFVDVPEEPKPKLLNCWTGRPGSNRRHPAWEAGVLPLNYSPPECSGTLTSK